MMYKWIRKNMYTFNLVLKRFKMSVLKIMKGYIDNVLLYLKSIKCIEEDCYDVDDYLLDSSVYPL